MPLYIRDHDVALLARAVQAASGARTVTDAVRAALERERDRLRDRQPAAERLARALRIADGIASGEPSEPW